MPGATKSEHWPLSKLRNWEHNPRDIQPDRFKELKTRLERQGQFKPLLVTKDGRVIGGNMRLRAMGELGWTEAWVSIVEAETDKEIFDLALTDNEEFGYYDKGELAELADRLNFTPLELESYELNLGKTTNLKIVLDELRTSGDDENDDAPDADHTNPPVSVEGEIYQLGNHRLMCGDATNLDDVEKLMDGRQADLIFTDPPYNVSYEGKTEDRLTIQNDTFKDGQAFYDFLFLAFSNLNAVSKAGAGIYVCHADSEGLNFRKAFVDAGYQLKQCLIWNKNVMVMGRQDYHWKHEPILYGWKPGKHYFINDRTLTTVWDFERPSRSEAHPTMKPVKLIEHALVNSSKRGSLVVDTFGGSGSTLIACDKLERTCYTMELDPVYCDVIRKRYAAHIGEDEAWQEATPALGTTARPQATAV